MRQVYIKVPREHQTKAKDIILKYEPINLAHIDAQDEDGPVEVFIANVSNRRVEGLFSDLNDIPETQITLLPMGVYAFRLATAQIPDQVTDIQLLSPIEVFLSGLQSIGSWKGFVGYAIAAGVLVWLGLFINSVVLLIAGMLVSPLAGPAMNLAIAIARGDTVLLRQSLMRYAVAISTAMIVSAILTGLTGLNMVTQQMDSMNQISYMAALIPLVIGMGGALSLIQSSSSSLVSGTVSGLLIAASLAPPVALIGIGSVLGEWSMVKIAVFVVILQLVGINLSGTVILRLSGLKSKDAHYQRGKPWIFIVGMIVSVILLVGLIVWQQADSPDLQKASVGQHIANDIKNMLDDNPNIDLIEIQSRFTRTDVQGNNIILIILYVQPGQDVLLPDVEIKSRLLDAIPELLNENGYNVTPFINVSVLSPP